MVPDSLPERGTLTDADRWILDRTEALIGEVDELLEDFQFAKSTEALYHFTWDEFCDWYVELSKVQIDEGGDRAESTRAVLGHVLDVVLKLLHPTIPFVTEKLWTTLTGGESVVVADWPKQLGVEADDAAAERVAAMQKLVTEIRRFRSDQGLKPGQKVAARLGGVAALGLAEHVPHVRSLVKITEPGEDFTSSASLEVAVAGGTADVELDLSGAIDVTAERKRLEKDLAAAEKELSGTEKKLANPSFTDKAPAEVVDKIKIRRDTAQADIDRITARLESMPGT